MSRRAWSARWPRPAAAMRRRITLRGVGRRLYIDNHEVAHTRSQAWPSSAQRRGPGAERRARETPRVRSSSLEAALLRPALEPAVASQRGSQGGLTLRAPATEITYSRSSSCSTAHSAATAVGVFADAAAPPARCFARRRSPTSSSASGARRARRCTTSGSAEVIGPSSLLRG